MAVSRHAATVQLQELAATLAAHGPTLCAPVVDLTPEAITLTVVIPRADVNEVAGLQMLDLFHTLEFLMRTGDVRAFASLYGIASPEIDKLIRKGQATL